MHTAAAHIEAAGDRALAVLGDVRDEESVQRAVAETVDEFGGIDICVNNASAIALEPTDTLPMKSFDLMTQIQLRGTYLLSRACMPHLRAGHNPHILSLSPPLNLSPAWLGRHPAYTLAKYGMSLLTLSLAAENTAFGVAANCLWPQTLIGTAAVANLLGGAEAMSRSRSPEIMADAAVEVLSRPSGDCSGNTFLDVEVLRQAGVSDFSMYEEGTGELEFDIFVDLPARHSAESA